MEEATAGTAASARYAPAEEGTDPTPNVGVSEVEPADYDVDDDEEFTAE